MTHFFTVLVVSITFTVILFGGQSLYWALIARRRREEREIVRRLGLVEEGEVDSLFSANQRDPAAAALGSFGEHLSRLLRSTDSNGTVTQLLMKMGLFGLTIGVVLLVFSKNPPASLTLGLAGFAVPYVMLRRESTKRGEKLIAQLPDALDLMARSMQAGLGLLETFRHCAEEMPIPVASEFGRVFEEIRLGREYREALGNLVRRNPGQFDLRLFVSSVLLQRETGGNLIEILDNISGTIRQRFVFKAKVKALTSEARTSAMILGSAPFMVVLALAFINPEYMMPFIEDPIGNLLLLIAFTMYTVGIFIMKALTNVEV